MAERFIEELLGGKKIERCDQIGGQAMGNRCSQTTVLNKGALGFFFVFSLILPPLTAPHAEETYYFHGNRQVVGDLIQLTKNNLVIRRAIGGMGQFAIRDLERIDITTDTGEVVSGRLVGFEEGVFEIEGRDLTWSVREGAIVAERSGKSDEALANEAAEWGDEAVLDGAGGPVIRIQPISIAVAPAKTREDADALRFDITLEPAPDQMLALIYTTMESSAVADEDYVSTQGVLSIDPGTTSLSIDVPLIDDDIPEKSERFTLYIATDPTAAHIDASRIEGLIDDND
ncbi:MAG: Calx-beta domain-containing protein [Geminicoccaceae bacterium]